MIAATSEVAAAAGPLTHRVLRTWDEARPMLAEWDELAKRTGADIYLSPIHAETWWKHYGRGRLVIVECREGERLVGVLPFFIATVFAGILPVRLGRLLTSDSTIVVLSPPIEPSHARACWAGAIRAVADAGADVVAICPLSGEDGRADDVKAAIADAGLRLFREHSPAPHTVYNLPESMDAYFASLDKKVRGNMKRPKRNLEESGKFEVRVATDADACAAFERFVRFHTERWQADGQPGHFGDWPGSAAYNADLVRQHAARGEVLIFELILDGELVGSEFAFFYGSRAFDRLPARVTGEKWDKVGLGSVIQLVLFESMLARGVRRAETGPGHYPYKLRAGGTEFPLSFFVACRRSAFSALKTRALLGWSVLLQYGYYRGWRARVLPRLGRMPGSLWRSWIRTRL
jgi:CelD/BcsL family acetyltransferase involved in cellulose biosynthesis